MRHALDARNEWVAAKCIMYSDNIPYSFAKYDVSTGET